MFSFKKKDLYDKNTVVLDEAAFFIKNKKIQPTFEAKTLVILQNNYINLNDPCSKFLRKGECFHIMESGLSAYPNILKRAESDRVDKKEYCMVKILNHLEFGDFACISTVVRGEDLKKDEDEDKNI